MAIGTYRLSTPVLKGFCKCGCGQPLVQKYINYIPIFISGHNNRGKKTGIRSKKQCQNISVGTKKAMNRFDILRKLHRGEQVPRVITNCGNCGKEIRGYKARKFCNIKCSHTFRLGKTYEQLYGVEKANKIKTIQRKRRLDCNQKFFNTKPERIMEEILNELRLKYKSQWNVSYITSADFFLPDYNILIFCDGCYWHCHEHMKLPSNRITPSGKTVKEIQQYDNELTKKLIDRGYVVLRFWECDLYKKVTQIKDILKETVLYARKSQVVNATPLVNIPLYAGKSGECSDTYISENFELQTISRQPAKAESPQRLYAEHLVVKI